MATSDKLNYLLETKDAIKTAIQNKGVEVSDTDSFRSYAEKIDSIENTGSGAITEDDEWQPEPDWWDIEKILEEDTDEEYPYKAIFLLSDAYDDNYNASDIIKGFKKYKLSDGQEFKKAISVNLVISNIFDITKDKECKKGYKTRYIIGYSDIEISGFVCPNNVLYAIYDKARMSSGTFLFNSRYLLQALKFKNGAGINGTSLNNAFSNCYSLEKIEGLDCSDKNDISTCFAYCLKLKSIANLNFGTINNANNCFSECYKLRDLGDIDFSKLDELKSFIISYCISLTDLSKYTINLKNFTLQYFFNLKKLPNISNEFVEPTSFFILGFYNIEEIPYKLKPKYSTSSYYLAGNCPNLKKIKYIDCSNMSNTTNISLFSNCKCLTEIEEIYNIHTPLNFINLYLLNKSTLLRILNALTDLTGETAKTLQLGSINLKKLSDEEKSIATNKNWILT